MSTEKKEKIIRVKVSDLGVGAFCTMYGMKPAGKNGRDIFFDIKESEKDEFDKLCFDYHGSTCERFDHNLLMLKKMANYIKPIEN